MRLLSLLLLAACLLPAQVVPVIFDTDMGNDIDDALALAMLHAFDMRKEAKLLAVTVTKDNVWAPRYVSAVNTFYGRAGIPIGMVSGGVTREEGKYNRQVVEKGPYPYTDTTADAVDVLRATLEKEKDGSVVMVQVGFSTNLARLLERHPDLVKQKVKLLSMMAGNFQKPDPEYNVKEDIASAKKLAAGWPTPVVWSGFEVGEALLYPATSIEHDYGWARNHPVADAYRHYMKFPYNRQTWDLTSALYAVRPDAGYFALSEPGTVDVSDKGITTFRPDPNGRHRYLKVIDSQKARIIETFTLLASQPAWK